MNMDKDIITEEVNAEYLKGFIYYYPGSSRNA